MTEKEKVGQSIERSRQEDEDRTVEKLRPFIFECRNPKPDRSPECTGKGYSRKKTELICSVCINHKKHKS